MFKSKVDVTCAFYNWHGRRDKLANHVANKHPNERPRCKDQSSLSNFFQSNEGNNGQSNKRKRMEDSFDNSSELVTDLSKSDAEDVNNIGDIRTEFGDIRTEFADIRTEFAEKWKNINESLTGLHSKMDGFILQSEQSKASDCNVMAGPSNSTQDEAFNAKIKLIRISKSILEISQLMPCLEVGVETIKCLKCVAYFKLVPKEVACLKTNSFGIFSLPSENQLIQQPQSIEFRNLKTHIINHLRSNAHKWCFQFSENEEQKEAMINVEQKKIGLRVARCVYSAIKEGKGGKFFVRQLSLNVLNDADVGELNHSRQFFREFRRNIFLTVQSKIVDFLCKKNAITNRLPLVSVTADKITKLHRTYQITCLITVINGIQTCILIDISPCGISHAGNALFDQLKKALENFHIIYNEQLNGMSFDGQYFDLSVDKKLASLGEDMDYDFFLPVWDLAHRLELALNDVKKNQALSWINILIQTVSNVMKSYNWGIGYEELIALADEMSVKFLNPKSFQQTRFVQSELRVYKTFERDFKLFFLDLQRKRVQFLKNGKNADAKNCSLELKKISKPGFIYEILGIIDILNLVTKFSLISQKINICVWTIFDYFSSMKMSLQCMSEEMKNNEVTEKNFPTLYEELNSLKANVYQDCLLIDEDILRESRSTAHREIQEKNSEEKSSFLTSRKKLEKYCEVLIERLSVRIPVPPIISNMRQCFSSKFITNDDERIKSSLDVLVSWVNRNRRSNFNCQVLFEQLMKLRKNLQNTEFFKNELNAVDTSDLIILDNAVIKESFTNPDVYTGIPDIIYLLENCMKICSEAVCESVGSVIGNHLHNRNIKYDTLFNEVFISWNGPPIHKASELLTASLDRHFHGGNYHFTRFSSHSRLKVYKTSKVIDNIHREDGKLDNIV